MNNGSKNEIDQNAVVEIERQNWKASWMLCGYAAGCKPASSLASNGDLTT